MGALRLLLWLVPTLYCSSVITMLFYLPSLQQRFSNLSKVDHISPRPPPIHHHVLIARMAYERCANLSRKLLANNGNHLRFVTIPGSHISVLTAYRDNRLPQRPFIRLLILMSGNARPQLHCHLPLSSSRMLSTPATLYQFNENHGMPFGGFIASCPFPTRLPPALPLCMVRVTDTPNANAPGVELLLQTVPQAHKHNLTACVPPMFGPLEASRLVEFIELNRLLGFQHFYLYDVQNRTGTDLGRVLDHYKRAGLVTLWRWQLPVPDASVWYRGQMLAIHHCLYVNMGVSRFTAFQDLDEVFVPQRHPDVPALLSEVDREQQHCGYRIFSAFFPPRADKRGLSSLRSYRTAGVSRLRTKCIVHPELIFEMGIHHISKQNIEEQTPHNLPEGLVLLHHNRPCDSSFGMNCHQFLTDDSFVHRFGAALTARHASALRDALKS